MATAAVQLPPQEHNSALLTKNAWHKSSKSRRNASEKEKIHLQTEKIVRGHVLKIARGHQFTAIRQCCFKVVEDHDATFLQLCKKLRPSRDSLHGNFMRVFANLFSGGITIGKIATSIAFSGKLVEFCTDSGLDVTDNLIAWTLDYFKHYISDWILNYGGWVCWLESVAVTAT